MTRHAVDRCWPCHLPRSSLSWVLAITLFQFFRYFSKKLTSQFCGFLGPDVVCDVTFFFDLQCTAKSRQVVSAHLTAAAGRAGTAGPAAARAGRAGVAGGRGQGGGGAGCRWGPGWVWAWLKKGNVNLRIEPYQCWPVSGPVTMISSSSITVTVRGGTFTKAPMTHWHSMPRRAGPPGAGQSAPSGP